jgi:hypothetical protein
VAWPFARHFGSGAKAQDRDMLPLGKLEDSVS